MKAIARIEIAKGSKYKFEYYIEKKELILDRVINLTYPYQYGAFINTIAPDLDELDCFVISHEPIPQTALCEVVIVGAFICTDNGISDDKLICYLDDEYKCSEAVYGDYVRIKHFLTNYKKDFEVLKYVSQDDAVEIYEESAKAFQDNADKNT